MNLIGNIIQFIKDGLPKQVIKDSVTPANNVGLPVEIVGSSATINIYADDLNVQLSDRGENPSTTKIGDGVHTAEITEMGEVQTYDLNLNDAIGQQDDEPASSDTGTFSFISLFKRLLTKFTSILSTLTDGSQKTQLVDLDGHIANIQRLDVVTEGNEYAIMTISNLQGKSSQGGGTWVDVKVEPSGKLLIKDDDVIANQTNGTQKVKIANATDEAAIVTGPNTGVKGLRVFGGHTDPVSDIPVSIPYDHHQIHEGETFRISILATLAINATKLIRIVVPNIDLTGSTAVVKCPHLRFELVSDASALIQLFRAPTVTGNGTQRTPIALEQNGTYIPKLQIWEDPTVSANGDLQWQGITTTSKNSAGNIDSPTNEFVLKNNTTYLFLITSNANSNRCLLRLVWYEDLGV